MVASRLPPHRMQGDGSRAPVHGVSAESSYPAPKPREYASSPSSKLRTADSLSLHVPFHEAIARASTAFVPEIGDFLSLRGREWLVHRGAARLGTDCQLSGSPQSAINDRAPAASAPPFAPI